MSKVKKNLPMIIMALAFTIGIGLVAYPTIADWWNSMHATRAIADYSSVVENLTEDEYEGMLEEAYAYNEDLLSYPDRYFPDEEFHERYENTMNVGGSGVIGNIQIPKIKVSLPIYHGTEDSVLQIAVGHIEGTSLPVGGESTHAALSGHRGLPSARLFTDLPELEIGDYFIITVLGETLTYEVDDISIVYPEEVSKLQIEEGKDLVTLITCTPYGINTQRLLVTGHRIENLPDNYVDVTNNAMLIDSKFVALFIGIATMIVLIIVLVIKTRNRKNG